MIRILLRRRDGAQEFHLQDPCTTSTSNSVQRRHRAGDIGGAPVSGEALVVIREDRYGEDRGEIPPTICEGSTFSNGNR